MVSDFPQTPVKERQKQGRPHCIQGGGGWGEWMVVVCVSTCVRACVYVCVCVFAGSLVRCSVARLTVCSNASVLSWCAIIPNCRSEKIIWLD